MTVELTLTVTMDDVDDPGVLVSTLEGILDSATEVDDFEVLSFEAEDEDEEEA